MSGNTISQISINVNLTMYINKIEEYTLDGSGSSIFFASRRKFNINTVNIKICI